jgi:hypothetical protein
MVCSCVFFAEEKYQKSKGKKKSLDKKKKRKKEKRKEALKEHPKALLSVVPFALFMSVATFHTCFLSSLFHSLIYHNWC